MILLLLWMAAAVAQQCAVPFEQCQAKCTAAMDSIATCTAMPVDGICTAEIKCQCDVVLARCKDKCAMAGGVESCACDKGVDTIVCADDGGLGTGGIVAIAVVFSLLCCALRVPV